ncbi:MAG: VWA domain-containing protein [Sarcina sp.]|nr:VWA domain-containing protein [Sarcina sp.]
MRKGLTELVFILDRSGSMQGLEKDTIGGFNSMIEKQKKEDGEALVSTVLFDDAAEVIYDRTDIGRVEPMTDRQYYVRGCTALLDAVGGAIHHIGNVHKYAREEDVPEKTIFIITTDGMENASRRYSYDKVQRMIERQKEKYHWEFLFLGANIDAVREAARLGISGSRAANYVHDSKGTQLNYDVLSGVVSRARASGSAEEMNAYLDSDEAMAPIREDFRRRSRGRR